MNHQKRHLASAAAGFLIAIAGCDKVAPPGMGGGESDPPQAARPAPVPSPVPPPVPPPAPAPGASTMPHSAPPPMPSAAPTSPPSEPSDPNVVEFVGLRGPKPATWVWRAPTSSMRVASYTVPGQEGSEAAEFVVFFFGPGQGGSAQGNIERWAGQFRSADESPVTPKVERLTVDEMPVTLVELAGEYMPMGQTWYSPDQLFLAGIVEAPAGSVFIRLTGPTATVEAHREGFMTLLRGLERAGG